ncbi:MAG: Gfo/Idh/MocA family oxidoreductase [Acidobacteria bacterium]|nr:Gfo/Idh/MocA family oxidoreductase [Acidobacteriota bacterium]
MNKLRIGIIGLGIGRDHAAGYKSHPRADLVAMADLDESRLCEFGDQYHVTKRYRSAEEMLANEKLDVVSVCTPNKFHAPLTMAALKAGAHVLCEKPMAMNTAEAQQMLAAARQTGKRIMINFSYRFDPKARALKSQVDAGVLGEIYFARSAWHRRRGLPGFGGWFGQKELAGGGPLIDLGVHRIDLALWLMGYPKPGWVLASTYNPIGRRLAKEQGKKFDVEDFAVGLIKFDNGATLEVEASWAANIAENELMETRLFGTKGGGVHRNVRETYEFEAEIYTERDGYLYDTKLHFPPGPPLQGQYYHFVESILTNTPHLATGEEGFIVMELLDAIYESAATGQPVEVKG